MRVRVGSLEQPTTNTDTHNKHRGEMTEHRRFMEIVKAMDIKELGDIRLIENNDINTIKFEVVPEEGFHKNEPYIVTLKFIDEEWPLLYIDSKKFDKLKTNQYINNIGYNGSSHKGICIQHFTRHYKGFKKYFKLYCNNEWKNYIHYIIIFFNNITEQETVGGLNKNSLININ